MTPPGKTIRITAPHFVAGVFGHEVVEKAAPILKYMVGWTLERVQVYATSKHWLFEIVEIQEDTQ